MVAVKKYDMKMDNGIKLPIASPVTSECFLAGV